MVNKRLSMLIRMHLTLFIIYCTAILSSHSFYTFPFSCILLVHCIHIAQPGLMVADCENMQDIMYIPEHRPNILMELFLFPYIIIGSQTSLWVSLSIRVGRSVGWSVCHHLPKFHFLAPIEALVHIHMYNVHTYFAHIVFLFIYGCTQMRPNIIRIFIIYIYICIY